MLRYVLTKQEHPMQHTFVTLVAAVLGLLSVLAAPVFAAGTEDTATETTASAYDEAKAMVTAENFVAALPALLALTAEDPSSADAWNLLGFTHRKLDQLDDSAVAYQTALTLNPDHLGALEYQGELFLQTGQPDLAKANLARLQGLCGDCEEYQDLAEAMKAAGA